ncbi:unnamed protein product [Cuscuta epithymum]|uniref:Uncharacterized protein n=1 Tax=Cuscuta epithymum TaxID=186058 RepID=A0AAV0D051_9ASTE|nr:unnamed protein product [Cuscuta epithymum]CAH9110270.1 unnamed protein product [Cuscuta epithymum]
MSSGRWSGLSIVAGRNKDVGKSEGDFTKLQKWSNLQKDFFYSAQGTRVQGTSKSRIVKIESKAFCFEFIPTGLHIIQNKNNHSLSISLDVNGVNWLCSSFDKIQSGRSHTKQRYEES